MIIFINNNGITLGGGGAAPPALPLLAGRLPAESLERFALRSLLNHHWAGGLLPPCIPPCAPAFGRREIIGIAGGAPAPPHPPLLAGLWPAGNLECFALRSLSASSSGTPTRLKDETERMRRAWI